MAPRVAALYPSIAQRAHGAGASCRAPRAAASCIMHTMPGVDRVLSSVEGFELDMFVEPTGAEDEQRLLAVVAWKGSRSGGAPRVYSVATGEGSAAVRLTQWIFRIVLSPLLAVMWIMDQVEQRRVERRM